MKLNILILAAVSVWAIAPSYAGDTKDGKHAAGKAHAHKCEKCGKDESKCECKDKKGHGHEDHTDHDDHKKEEKKK